MIGTADEDSFISASAMALVCVLRKDGSPTARMVSFARDGDDLFFTTTLDRLMGRSVTRDPRLALSIVNKEFPFDFVTVEGVAEIQADGREPFNEAIIAADLAHGLPYTREEIQAMVDEPGRVIVHVRPTRVAAALISVERAGWA